MNSPLIVITDLQQRTSLEISNNTDRMFYKKQVIIS